MPSSRERIVQCCALMVLGLACGQSARGAQQSGTVQSGNAPVALSTVTLYRAGISRNASPAVLGTARTDATGTFTIVFRPSPDPTAILYLVAVGGSVFSGNGNNPLAAIKLANVIGSNSDLLPVVINERTTVATAYAMAQFIQGSSISGKSPGLQNAAATLRNLVNVTSGGVGSVLGNSPNGLETSTMRQFNSLANMLAACVNTATPEACAALFSLATPPGGTAPNDTLQAAVNIAHYPSQNAAQLFDQAQILRLYQPGLLSAPDAWTLAITYDGNGAEFDGLGNMAIDGDGNVWATNNYMYNADPTQTVCGDTHVLKVTPTGLDAPGAPYSGGGLYGAGFGITLDPDGNLWAANFGFQGSGCNPPPPANANDNSVSEFDSNGNAISLVGGFTKGNILEPQGTASDQQGNIWIANCGNSTVTEFPHGNPNIPWNFRRLPLVRPFGLAVDADGDIWISSNGNDSVIAFHPSGQQLSGSPFSGGGIVSPLGVATDSRGNVWIANSGAIQLPCGIKGVPTPGNPVSVTEISHGGQGGFHTTNFTGGGLTVPWGIAIDGNDNVWVANFGGQHVSEFCGARPGTCPTGLHTGDPISPETGYTSDALTRNTGIAIDPSGNVWLANNWMNVPLQTNPGGHGLVVFIGLAAPVQTPVIGPPHQP
jgi:streptogramin lyase